MACKAIILVSIFFSSHHLSCFDDYQLQRQSSRVPRFDDSLEKMAGPLQSVTDQYGGQGVFTRKEKGEGEQVKRGLDSEETVKGNPSKLTRK